jgi:hypothetical protein
MFKLTVIVIALLAAVPAIAQDWRETINRGVAEMDARRDAERRQLHDMRIESYAHEQAIEQHNSNITQEGIRDQMILNGGRYPY